MLSKIKETIAAPFIHRDKVYIPLLMIFLVVNSIVLINAVIHPPQVGYDSVEHLKYIWTISKFKLPAPEDTAESFSPPLPYVLPAAAQRLMARPCATLNLGDLFNVSKKISGVLSPCTLIAGKLAQLLNVIYSLGLTFYLLKICEVVHPGKVKFKVASLALLGMLPVYYKSFAFVRGEPLLAFLTVLAVHQFLGIVLPEGDIGRVKVVVLGVSMGLMILSRQWGFLVLLAMGLFLGLALARWRREALPIGKALFLSLGIAFLVGGWFYISLLVRYDSVTEFNREGQGFSFSNQPAEFYFDLGLKKLFTLPLRLSFRNRMLPVFYSETWGDYWNYFTVTGQIPGEGFKLDESNRQSIKRYLGRVNLASTIPSAVYLLGMGLGGVYFVRTLRRNAMRGGDKDLAFTLFLIIVLVSLGGYLWFLVSYPRPENGDTIKATYMLQIFPFIALLAGEFLRWLENKNRLIFRVVVVLMTLVFLHNLPVLFSHYG